MRCCSLLTGLLAALLVAAAGCDGAREPDLIELEVIVDPGGVPTSTTDLGYEITITRYRLAASNLFLTVEGEAHASLLRRLWDRIVPSAHAHPGHVAGGRIAGELRGPLVLDFVQEAGERVGIAQLLAGRYRGADLSLRRAGDGDELDANDPIDGHTAYLEGTATRDGKAIQFVAALDLDEGSAIVGLPLDLEVGTSTAVTLVLQVNMTDPVEGDTLLDGVDFALLDTDRDGKIAIAPGQAPHNAVRRAVGSHDHYAVSTEDAATP